MTKAAATEDPTKNVRGNTKTTRKDWLGEAKRLLIEEGVAQVKIDRLARNLKVTRGGFYWFFKNRQDLLDILLTEWEDSRNDPLIRAVQGENKNPLDPLVRLFFTLLNERAYVPALDSAVRDWARTSKRARQAVNLVDNRRINALTETFQNLDYEQEEAFIRARIFYFHQVGYYAMEVHETDEQRLHYVPIYFKQLTGHDLPEETSKALSD